MRPITRPNIAGTIQARPILANGSLLWKFATLSIKLTGMKLSFGNETMKSSNAVKNVKVIVVEKTFLLKPNAFPKRASNIRLIASG